MTSMFTLPRLSDYIKRYPSFKTRRFLVEFSGMAIGVAALAFTAQLAPLWLPLAVWFIAASLDLSTVEFAPEAGRGWAKCLSVFMVGFASLAAYNSEAQWPPQLIIIPAFCVSMWMMVRSQPDEETADS